MDDREKAAVESLRGDLRDRFGTLNTKISVMEVELRDTRDALKELVTRFEFTPVKLLVYGMVGTILSSALVALLAKVIVK